METVKARRKLTVILQDSPKANERDYQNPENTIIVFHFQDKRDLLQTSFLFYFFL